MKPVRATKYLLATVGLLFAAGGAAAVVGFNLGHAAEVSAAVAKRDALAWLRTEFRLNESQFVAIRTLHEAYSVVCEEHCRAIQEAAGALTALKAAAPASGNGAVVAGPERQLEELRVRCETAIGVHVRQVAEQMPPAEGQRYLALVLPKISGFDHRAAPDLGLTQHRH